MNIHMGINKLFAAIEKYAPDAIVTRKLSDYKNQVFAIDAVLAIYQWCSTGVSNDIRNKAGKYINHIQGTFFRTAALIAAGIKPVYVFDGIPPDVKSHTLMKRRGLSRINIPAIVYAECKKLIQMMGVEWITAPSEAEAQAAAMTRDGSVDVVMTEDSDALAFGARKIVRMKISGRVVEYDLEAILHGLNLTYNEFVDVCILMGSDYTISTPRGIGPKKAIELIQKYGNIEGIEKRGSIVFGDNFNYVAAREAFLHHKVERCECHSIRRLDSAGMDMLRRFLVDGHGLDQKRVDAALGRMQSGYDRLEG